MKPRILLTTLPLALILAGCKESPSGSSEESAVAITYAGGVSGSLAAEGEYAPTSPPNTQTFAIASRGVEGTLEVAAYRQRGGGRFDIATITVPNAAVGQVSVNGTCPGETCAAVTLGLDLGQATGAVAAHTCHLDTGTIRVTALSATRASGTFSGSGFCIPGSGGADVDFQVSSGSFDIQVRQR